MKINPKFPFMGLYGAFRDKNAQETRKFIKSFREAVTSEEKYLQFKEDYKHLFIELEAFSEQFKNKISIEEYCEFHLQLRKEFHNED